MLIFHTDPWFPCTQVKFQDNEVIVREGAEGDTFYIILKGEVREGRVKCNTVFLLLLL